MYTGLVAEDSLHFSGSNVQSGTVAVGIQDQRELGGKTKRFRALGSNEMDGMRESGVLQTPVKDVK